MVRHPIGLLRSLSFASRRSWRAVVLFCLFAATCGSSLGQTSAPLSYYDSAAGKTGPALKAALHTIIRNHTVLPYTAGTTDTWDAIKILDEDPTNANRVVLIYSGLTDLKSNQDTGTTGSWNREHLWPRSFGLEALQDQSRAHNDLFNLWACDKNVNTLRSNMPFDVSVAPISTNPEAPGSSYDTDTWEPRDADKGAIARALFYMATRYENSDADVPNLELSDTPNEDAFRFGKLTTLLKWNRQFPPAPAERQRNERIYANYQHNRNPFIDRPEFADMVFVGGTANDAWKQMRFSSAELSNSSVSGDLADPDRDGTANLIEYALGRNPKAGDTGTVITTSMGNAAGTNYLFLSFDHNRAASDAQLTFEGSADLKNWSPLALEVVSATPMTFDLERIVVRFPTNGNTAYSIRLRVTRNAP